MFVIGMVGPFGSGCTYVANTISDKRIEQEPFEGVTYNGYFRLMEVLK